MDDALFMPGTKRFRDLTGDSQGLVQRDWPSCEMIRESCALDEFEHQCANPVGLLNPVDARDVRMVEGREEFGLALESDDAIPVRRNRVREGLQRNVTLEAGVPRPIDLPHPAFAEEGNHFERTEPAAGNERHGNG